MAPTPAEAAKAKKLNNVKPTPWSVTFMIGRLAMPGSKLPSTQPTLNERTSGSVRMIFMPSTGVVAEVLLGREYAVAAKRRDRSTAKGKSLL